MARVNAPGEMPSPERVELIARNNLGMEDDPETPVPSFYTPLLAQFLADNPGDTNFLIELEPGVAFGTITCMEDLCWNDTVLTADPDREDGGKADGLGSFYEYAVHCHGSEHTKSRDKRLVKQGVVIPPPTAKAKAVLPQDIAHAGPSSAPGSSSAAAYGARQQATPAQLQAAMRQIAVAGPSSAASGSKHTPRAGSSAITPVSAHHTTTHNAALSGSRHRPPPLAGAGSATSATHGSAQLHHTNSSPLASRSVNLPDVKPALGKSSDAIIRVSDSDDEGITFVGSAGPSPSVATDFEYQGRKQANPLRSSQSDTKSISKGHPSSSQSSQAKEKPAWTSRWNGLGLSEKRAVIKAELNGIRTILRRGQPAFILAKALERRKHELKMWQHGALMTWHPAEAVVLDALPDNAFHPAMAGSYNTQPGGKPTNVGLPVNAVAGPSTGNLTPGLPGAFPAVSIRSCPTVWKTMQPQERFNSIVGELKYLKTRLAEIPPGTLESIVQMGNQRMADLSRLLNTTSGRWPDAHWTPPNSFLLHAFPKIRELTGEKLRQFLPAAYVSPGQYQPPAAAQPSMDDTSVGYEFDRPLGKDLQTFLQESLNDFSEDVDVEAGLKILKLNNINEKLPGANFTMMPHQVLGVAFMVTREERTSGSRGGFLLDAMGLGKTVQCISLMLMRDTRPSGFAKSPQLIVAPLALLAQWKSEIETKTTKNWRILVHHGTGRPKTAAALKNYDIVLTTYGTLMSESGLLTKEENKKKKQKKRDGEDDDDDDEIIQTRKRGPLFSPKWFRVILDEGHLVRNKGTRTAKAVLELDVLHPWILTGTPIVNSLADLGPGLSFIGQMDLKEFQTRVSSLEKKKPKLAAKRCQAIMRPLMMRRTKDTELNGKRILELPPKVTNLASLRFELEERAIYAALEQRARVRVNKFIQSGTLMKNYSIILQLLTRLRQCVNHPWLLRRKPGDTARADDLVVEDDGMLGADMSDFRADDAAEYGRAVSIVGEEVVQAMAKKLKERYESMTDEAEDSEPQDMECAICYEPFEGTEIITPCSHIYCKGCIMSLFTEPMFNGTALTDEQIQSGCRSCPLCREAIWPGKVFRAAAIFHPPVDEKPDVDEEGGTSGTTTPGGLVDRKGKKRATPDDVADFFASPSKKGKERAKSEDEESGGFETPTILPSTKMRHLLELVQGYLAEDPNVKILVFSQFVEFLDLVRDFLKINEIDSIDYRGSMSQPQRDEAIRRFNMSSEIAANVPIMLISTKAGGVGLNLTMASKVIMCELAWNPATENQAVDRAHRIGQAQQVNVERLVIADSVEDRLLEIQERKGLLADGAMGEGDVGRLGRLTVDDIRNLFAIGRDYSNVDDE